MDERTLVHVGCGPLVHLDGWINVDIHPWPTVDEVIDVTKDWPFFGVEYVFAEHFLQELPLRLAIEWLTRAVNSLAPDGVLRISTPNLPWVMHTHWKESAGNTEIAVSSTLACNRAFRGWGHQFLWSHEFADWLGSEMGISSRRRCIYGESSHDSLRGVERHAPPTFSPEGDVSVVIFEWDRPANEVALSARALEVLEANFLNQVEFGH